MRATLRNFCCPSTSSGVRAGVLLHKKNPGLQHSRRGFPQISEGEIRAQPARTFPSMFNNAYGAEHISGPVSMSRHIVAETQIPQGLVLRERRSEAGRSLKKSV